MPRTPNDGITEIKMTRWHNPTAHKQTVVIHPESAGDRPYKITWDPDETREVSSRFDRAIHIVDCGQEDCRRNGGFCSRGHEGNVVGGGAPLLRRLGANDRLDDALDPNLAAKKEAQARMIAEAQVQRAAAAGMIQALAQSQEAQTKIDDQDAKLEELTRPEIADAKLAAESEAKAKAKADALLEAANRSDDKPAHIPSKK